MTLSMVVASIISGALITRIGYYTPFMILGSCVMSIGSGLLTTLQTDTGAGKWIGYQIIWGLGMGMTFQAPNLAAQTVLKTRDVPIGTTLMFFSQLMGGAIFTSVAQNVLNNELLRRLSPLPGFKPTFISEGGATELASMLPPELLQPVLRGYNEALRTVFHVGLILTCLTVLGAVGMEWRSVKKNVKKPDAEANGAVAAGEKSPPASSHADARSDAETAVDKDGPVPSAAPRDVDAEKKESA
jgi:MFS family permease